MPRENIPLATIKARAKKMAAELNISLDQATYALVAGHEKIGISVVGDEGDLDFATTVVGFNTAPPARASHVS